MANEAKRRFLDLKVNEVSLVDTPANEQRFVVMKRLKPEDGTMADVKKDEAQVTKANDAELVAVDVTKGGSASGVDELLNGLTALIAKAKGEAPPEEDVAKAASKKAAMDGYASKLKACGMDAAGVKMAMEAFKGFEFDVGPGGQAPLQKGKETDMENTAKSLSEEQLIAKTLEGVLAGIQKAKTFTPTRQAAMKSAMETLKGLLEDLESGAENKGNIPSAEEMAGQGSAPKDGKIGSGLQDIRQNAPVMKALEQLVEVTKGLASSLEEVKKTRAAPTNVAADGGADAKVVKKSMWSGVL